MSKKKGMLSWLGFGKKEKQPSTEKENNEALSVAEDEQATTAEPLESVVDQAEESITEQQVEKEVPADVVNEDVSALNDVIEDSSAEIPDDKSVELDQIVLANEEQTKDVDTELTKSITSEKQAEANLLAEMEAAEQNDSVDDVEFIEEAVEVKAENKLGFFARLKQGLSKTRQNLGGGLIDLFRGKQIDDDLFEELETHLLLADVGVETTMKIIDSLTQSANRKQLKDASALYDLLKIELKKVIEDVTKPLVIPEEEGPFVILMVGVNGVGKTTTIGKLAKQFQAQGKSVMLAAGDTFRAAAVEQLQVWGERNDIPVIAQHTGADSASVIFDAISAAKARNVDIIIADTAGRLQNKAHLMEELKKVVRVMKKLDVNAPHEVMLTLDAGTGQNALSQTKLFDEAVGLTGLTITKLDGTAKGGVVFAVADKYQIPIRYLGVGEGIDDLRPFIGDDFIEALFSKDQ
ncbi:cell division transporter substrate-binding protein FtsY [Colwellia psychrerythraea]|uniref:Signal recognition particle receptor FtsY n=2 Tax=Colwellia psychrerythraea TaxID=28229 RepID=A0A099KR17_COLPS|nr:signal recognition particle-docking protein FtsY [Colwellia psychrerythraea]KGJ92620.1 cell division transporter substrate-binding protein FtsY [Colwellia psychrerythraea]